MSLAASPPPASLPDVDMNDTIDDEIVQVREEIQALTKSRKLLTSSLLASTKVQSRLLNDPSGSPTASQEDSTAPANLSHLQNSTISNAHRLALGVTAFPFTDPSPELQSMNPLLGIRIDICNRHGMFDSAYYIFCVRAKDTGEELRIHRHTIPALVPLEQYEREYLPIASSLREDDEGYVGSDGADTENTGQKRQNLHALVGRVRYDLVSWRLRQDAAAWLKDELGLAGPSDASKATDKSSRQDATNQDIDMQDSDSDDSDDEEQPRGKYSVESLEAQEVDARQLRIIWSNDQVGRLKISDTGRIEKAVVIGEDGARVRDVERMLMGDDQDSVNVKQLVERLEMVHHKKEREAQTSHEMAKTAKSLSR